MIAATGVIKTTPKMLNIYLKKIFFAGKKNQSCAINRSDHPSRLYQLYLKGDMARETKPDLRFFYWVRPDFALRKHCKNTMLQGTLGGKKVKPWRRRKVFCPSLDLPLKYSRPWRKSSKIKRLRNFFAKIFRAFFNKNFFAKTFRAFFRTPWARRVHWKIRNDEVSIIRIV